MKNQNGSNGTVADNCVLLNLEFRMLGNTRKVHTSEIEAQDADKTLLRVSKHLFDAPEYKQISSFMGELRSWVYTMTLPSYFKAGMYLTPVQLVEEINKELTKAATDQSGMFNDEEERRLPALIADFKKAYPRLVEESLKRLGKLAKATDYPTVSEVEKMFAIEWKWLSIDVPTKLKDIDAKLFEIEREKARKQWQEAAEQITILLRQNMAEMLDRIVERLTPAPDGSEKRFKNTTVTALTDFMELFDARNVVNDQQLAALVEKTRQVMNGVDADSLREFEGTRNKVKKAFTLISDEIKSSVVVAKPKRQITFED